MSVEGQGYGGTIAVSGDMAEYRGGTQRGKCQVIEESGVKSAANPGQARGISRIVAVLEKWLDSVVRQTFKGTEGRPLVKRKEISWGSVASTSRGNVPFSIRWFKEKTEAADNAERENLKSS